MSWAWEHDYVAKLPAFPKPKEQRDVAGRHYLTKPDLNALYFATYKLPRLRGWNQPYTVGHYWRAALVVFFNYGVDTGTVFKSAGFHEPILWRHVTWRPEPPNGQGKESRYGWMYYRRVKTQKQFHRPMNRVVHAHLKSIRPETPQPDGDQSSPVARHGPTSSSSYLCELGRRIKPKQDVETGEEKLWVLKDLRKNCCDLLRRAHAGIVNRDSRPLGRRRHVPALRSPRPTGVQSDHDPAAADGIHRVAPRIRWRVSVLPPKIRSGLIGVSPFARASTPPSSLRRCPDRGRQTRFLRAVDWSNRPVLDFLFPRIGRCVGTGVGLRNQRGHAELALVPCDLVKRGESCRAR